MLPVAMAQSSSGGIITCTSGFHPVPDDGRHQD